MSEPAAGGQGDTCKPAACDACGAELTPIQQLVVAMLWAAGIRRVGKFCETCWQAKPRETARPSFKKVHQRSEP